jgi:DNA-binding CsgD family transcriptional regulator
VVGIDRFYAETLEHGVSGMLAHLGRELGATAIGITTRTTDGAVVQRWLGLEPAFDAAYLAHFHDRDPFLQSAARLGLAAGRCAAGQELVDDATRARSELVHELFRPFGFGDLQGGILRRDDTSLVSLGMMRPHDAPWFTRDEAATLEGWFPHVRNALDIVSLSTRTGGTCATAHLSEHGRVVGVMGDEAQLLRTFRRDRGELLPREAALLRPFLAAVQRAAREGVPCTLRTASAFLLVRPCELGGVLVEEHRLGVADDASRERLRDAFRLSPSEAELACAIADGDEPACFAARRGVRISTVRTQLRAVFRKTGTTKQAELAALVAAIVRLPR